MKKIFLFTLIAFPLVGWTKEVACPKLFEVAARTVNGKSPSLKDSKSSIPNFSSLVPQGLREANRRIEALEDKISDLNIKKRDLEVPVSSFADSDWFKDYFAEIHKRHNGDNDKEDYREDTKKADKAADLKEEKKKAETKVKIKSLEAQIKKLEEKILDEKMFISKLSKELKETLLGKLDSVLNDPVIGSFVRDQINYRLLQRIPDKNKVTILAGNNFETPKDFAKRSEQIRELTEEIVSRNYYVVFDAQTPFAEVIAKVAGPRGIAVAGAPIKNRVPNTLIIENDFLRLEALSDSESVIATRDSVTGIGLFIEDKVTYFLEGGKDKDTAKDFNLWVREIDYSNRNLGVARRKAQSLNRAKDLFVLDERLKGGTVQELVPSLLSPKGLYDSFTDGARYAELAQQNKDSGGSVIFGSSSEDEHSANLIYQSAYQLSSLGIAVATGGSGGAMKIANSGAWNGGGISIGVPVGGKLSLDTEKDVESDIHTKTIVTGEYSERIPILLGDGKDARKLIIFAPGGDGTMRELATTLVRAAAKMDSFQQLILLDAEYYVKLNEFLNSLELPAVLKRKIQVVNDADTIKKIGLDVQERFEAQRASPPRSKVYTYEVKKEKREFESKWKDWYGDDDMPSFKIPKKGKKDKKKDEQ